MPSIVAQITLKTIHFENGQASISLMQLEELKKLAKEAIAAKSSRILVYSFANDAQTGDTNARLSGRRAYLVQQCLEREGISLAHMQVESKLNRSEPLGCKACAEISLTTDENFLFRNIYQENLANFLIENSAVQVQSFWIKPFEDALVTTKEGVLIRIPKGSLATKDSLLVKIDVRFVKNKWDLLLHSLTTRSTQQEFLEMNRAVYLDANQNGLPITLKKDQLITVVLPSDFYTEKTVLYQKEATAWAQHQETNYLKVGHFYNNQAAFCDNNNNNVGIPNYELPPTKPIYWISDSMTLEQDKQLREIQVRLDYLEEQKVDEKGKVKALNPQQKQNEYLLKNQKDRILIVKEKIKIKTRTQNEELEQVYYKTLAEYNKHRNALQHSYINGLNRFELEQKNTAARCEESKKNIESLQQSYGQEVYNEITSLLHNYQSQENIGYWLKTAKLGWLGIGTKSKLSTNELVPYRVKSAISAYKITAFLILEETQEIVLGETLDETDIVFWEVPDGKSAKILAVTQEGDNFLVAFHQLTTGGNPINLEFRGQTIKEALEQLKF